MAESDNDNLDYYSWLDKLTVALPSLSLLCLRVFVSQEEIPPMWLWDAAEERDVALKFAREREVSRVQKLAALPTQLVRALPSLQYLALGDTAPNLRLVGNPSAPIIHAEDKVVTEWDELRRTPSVKKQSWWKVVNGPHGKELVAISEEEGEEAQWLIETMTVDSDTTHGIEGKLSQLLFLLLSLTSGGGGLRPTETLASLAL
ncbi:hypothetical protein L226DRAFT_573116 [Lentinus tigrinus ALCF2SS1-7]|uniref:uncharacterized protein n=1 Tax=Lentinus tigrinus ALCF2SS1-7 TaxID=1328758 RepID=UPI001165F2C1|nr:hypothetical protein L226DRAFT_573116 [Lentinus tigrinus ALCF2SS1-7]